MKKIIILLVLALTFTSLLAQEKTNVSSSTIASAPKPINKKKTSNKIKKKVVVTKQTVSEVKQETMEAVESQTLSPKKHPNPLPIAPTYKDGKQAMQDFIIANLKVPNELKKNAVKLIVTVTFKVNADGSLTDVKARNIDTYGCDLEAERIVKLMPNWVPGRVGRTLVEMPMAIDIEFK